MPGRPRTTIKKLKALQSQAEAVYFQVLDLRPEQYRDPRAATRYALGGWWSDAAEKTIAAHSALEDLIEALEDHAERNRPACAEARAEAAEADNTNGKPVAQEG